MIRRDFIKTGGTAALGAMVMPPFLEGCTSSAAAQTQNIAFALDHFGVSEKQLQKVLSAALANGGNYADIFFEHTLSNALSLQDGAVNSSASGVDYGVGIRVISGDQTGYAYVEDITFDEMIKAAQTAARIADSSAIVAPINLTEMAITNNYYSVIRDWEEISVNEKIPYLQTLNEKIFALDNRVIKVMASMQNTTSHILFCNSEGQMFYDYRPMAQMSATCIMAEGNRTENSFGGKSLRMGAEFLTDNLIDEIATKTVQKTAFLFNCIQPQGGEMPVVMGCGESGILLHEAIGHAFEADFNRKNASIFSDKLGSKVCDESINIFDDGTVPYNRGSINIDDEGVEGQKTYLIRNGVLNSYMHDRISAKHYGVAPTGNGRRQSFRHMPIPRMRATCMEAGSYSEEEIIASVKKGIYAANFTNGQVQIGAGDFTFFMKDGYMIENGKLTQPIKDVNIIGNGPQALADITMVGNNYKMDLSAGTCGKDGQSCPVAFGMPSALVKKLTVGGGN